MKIKKIVTYNLQLHYCRFEMSGIPSIKCLFEVIILYLALIFYDDDDENNRFDFESILSILF